MVAKTGSKKKPYIRKGKTVAGGHYAYPKRYEISIKPDERGVVQIHRTNENFNAWELYGHLRMVLLDLERQLAYSTTEASELIEKKNPASDNHAKD